MILLALFSPLRRFVSLSPHPTVTVDISKYNMKHFWRDGDFCYIFVFCYPTIFAHVSFGSRPTSASDVDETLMSNLVCEYFHLSQVR